MAILMKPPGIDLSDPKTLSGAKAIATRKNNRFRKMVEEKLPLFADELFADYEPVTPEKVIEDRKIIREGWNQQKKEIRALYRERIRQYREEIRSLVSNETEWLFIVRFVGRLFGGGRDMKWYRALMLVRRRREKPLSENADLVLAWLSAEEKPVTHFDIWERRGDGLTHMQILNALMELSEYAYAGMVEVVGLPEKYHDLEDWKSNTAWTWEAVKQKG